MGNLPLGVGQQSETAANTTYVPFSHEKGIKDGSAIAQGWPRAALASWWGNSLPRQ